MSKYIEKILGVYGEGREKLKNDLYKKEIPMAAASMFSLIPGFLISSLFFIPPIYFISRVLEHKKKESILHFLEKDEELMSLIEIEGKDYEPRYNKIEW